MEIVHPEKPSTWRNHPAPYLEPNLVQQLTRIGGLNLYGESILRFVWGQARVQFRRGKERLLYVDERIEAIKHSVHLLKRPLITDAAGRVSHWETKQVGRAPSVVPEGWCYEEKLASVEFIGKQMWFVEQWYPPIVNLPNGETFLPFGTPAQWERDRYEDWEDPEIGFVKNCDVLGPFPSRGRYTAVMCVSKPFTWTDYEEENVHEYYFNCGGCGAPHFDKDYEGIIFKCADRKDLKVGEKYAIAVDTIKVPREIRDVCYRELGQDVIEEFEFQARVREQRHIEKIEQRTRDLYYEDDQRRARARDQRLEHARAKLTEDAWRWQSADSGPTGGIGGGSRVYIENTDAAEHLNKREEAA